MWIEIKFILFELFRHLLRDLGLWDPLHGNTGLKFGLGHVLGLINFGLRSTD